MESYGTNAPISVPILIPIQESKISHEVIASSNGKCFDNLKSIKTVQNAFATVQP